MKNLLILISISCSSIAQILLKKGMMAINESLVVAQPSVMAVLYRVLFSGYIWTAITFQIITMLTWLFVLKNAEVSYAYPFIALGIVFVLILSYFIFNEKIGDYGILGIILVVIGLTLLGKS